MIEEFEGIKPHILKAFRVYHQENPHIYKLFEKFI